MTDINLGSFFSVNGRNLLGGSSGFPVEDFVNTLADARRIPITRLEDKIEVTDTRITALGQLKDRLKAVQDAADLLRNPPGVNNDINNTFNFRTASITSNNSTTASSVLSVTAEAGAALQSYKIDNISSIAQEKRQTTNDFSVADADTQVVFTAPGANQFGAGTITITKDSVDTDITLVDGDSLNQVAAKFNAVSENTGIQATVLEVSSGTFKLLFTATETGLDNDFDLSNASTVTSGIALLSNLTFTNSQNAGNTVFDFEGVTITRQDRVVEDLIADVSFTLLQVPTGGTEITVDIDADTTVAKNGIINFINAYNEFKIFTAEQTELNDDGEFSEEAVLGSDATLSAALNTIVNQLSSVVNGLSGDYQRLSDLGITFTDLPADDINETPFTRNILTVDEDALDNALAANPQAVRKVFEFTFSADDPDIGIFSRTNDLAATSFSVTHDGSGGFTATYGSTTVDLTATALGDTGYSLVGPEGSDLEGLQMVFASTSAKTINVNVSQGIGDLLFNSLGSFVETDTGIIDSEISSLVNANIDREEDIDRLEVSVERYIDQLLGQFALLEGTISSVNSILSLIEQGSALAASD